MLFYIHPLCRIELIRLRFFPQRWQTVVYVIAVFQYGSCLHSRYPESMHLPLFMPFTTIASRYAIPALNNPTIIL